MLLVLGCEAHAETALKRTIAAKHLDPRAVLHECFDMLIPRADPYAHQEYPKRIPGPRHVT
jgi:hypothetical protein